MGTHIELGDPDIVKHAIYNSPNQFAKTSFIGTP